MKKVIDKKFFLPPTVFGRFKGLRKMKTATLIKWPWKALIDEKIWKKKESDEKMSKGKFSKLQKVKKNLFLPFIQKCFSLTEKFIN